MTGSEWGDELQPMRAQHMVLGDTTASLYSLLIILLFLMSFLIVIHFIGKKGATSHLSSLILKSSLILSVLHVSKVESETIDDIKVRL